MSIRRRAAGGGCAGGVVLAAGQGGWGRDNRRRRVWPETHVLAARDGAARGRSRLVLWCAL